MSCFVISLSPPPPPPLVHETFLSWNKYFWRIRCYPHWATCLTAYHLLLSLNEELTFTPVTHSLSLLPTPPPQYISKCLLHRTLQKEGHQVKDWAVFVSVLSQFHNKQILLTVSNSGWIVEECIPCLWRMSLMLLSPCV